MKINRKTALDQIGRFERYPNFPHSEFDRDGNPLRNVALEDLIKAFQNAATSDENAEAIGDHVIRRMPDSGSKFCPIPAEIYQAAEEVAQRYRPVYRGLTISCADCSDTGWLTVDRSGVGTATRCHCRGGRKPEPKSEPVEQPVSEESQEMIRNLAERFGSRRLMPKRSGTELSE